MSTSENDVSIENLLQSDAFLLSTTFLHIE